MAATGNTVPTLVDVAKGLDPNGAPARVAEILSQRNEIFDSLHVMQGNLPTGHRLTMRTGLPTAAWRLLNNGVTPGKSSKAQVDEQCGMMQAFSEVDKKLAELSGDIASFRLSEATAFIEAMGQEAVGTLFYGNSGLAPEEFTGLGVRYSSTSAANGQNVLSAGGSGSDNTSIWLTVSGPETFGLLYPKSSQAGLRHKDMGEQVVQTGTGIGTGRMIAMLDSFEWDLGMYLKDWRYVVRIPNIDVSDLLAQSTTQASSAATAIIKLMSRAMHRIPSFSMGRAAWHMNRTVLSMLDVAGLDKSASAITVQPALDQFGNPTRGNYMFRGVPIKVNDQLLNTESVVS